MKPKYILAIVVLFSIALVFLWMILDWYTGLANEYNQYNESDFVQSLRSVIRPEFMPLEKQKCQDFRSTMYLGSSQTEHNCAKLNWQTDNYQFTLSDSYVWARTGSWDDQVLLIVPSSKSLNEMTDLDIFNNDANYTFFNNITCLNKPTKLGKVYFNNDTLIYIFSDFAAVVHYLRGQGIDGIVGGCKIPITSTYELTNRYNEDRDYSIVRAKFPFCYDEGLSLKNSYDCFIAQEENCRSDNILINYCYKELASNVGVYNLSKAFELCNKIDGTAGYPLYNCWEETANAAMIAKNVSSALEACQRIEESGHYDQCISEIALLETVDNADTALSICMKSIDKYRYDGCITGVAKSKALENSSRAIEICETAWYAVDGCYLAISEIIAEKDPITAAKICDRIEFDVYKEMCYRDILLGDLG